VQPALPTAIIRMGQSLNLRVVAEGVETQVELEFLQFSAMR
jgi:EAL domain-containing protein (putative c-di-GMP-specific phosphodiesterase class I)